MDITRENREGRIVFHLSGEMDLYTSQDAREIIKESFAEGHKNIILDCRNLEYIDSSGIGVLISLFTSLRKNGGSLSLCGLQKPVETVITFAKLNGFLDITESLDDALARTEGIKPSLDQACSVMTAGILQDDNHSLFNTAGMYSKEFNLDLRRVRRLSQLILQKAPPEIREVNLLEQQISEIIKNAVRHGNKNDPNKKIRIWFSFSLKHAHVIVQDSGSGFHNIDHWNRFYARKMKAYKERDFETLMNYLSYRTENSREEDGGNALFAAVEFWNKGVVFSSKGNKIAVCREY